MKLKRYGFFKELEHGDAHGESLKLLRGSVSYDEKQLKRIVQYLESGHVFIASPGVFFDIFKEEQSDPLGNAHLLTDGEWCWPADLPYYVQNYGVPIPKEMLENMKKNNWSIPENIDISNLIL